METKYVRFNDDTFIMFSNQIPHDSASTGPQRFSDYEIRDTRRIPVSAGFVTIEDSKFVCYGKSESLGLSSKKDDTEMINKSLRF